MEKLNRIEFNIFLRYISILVLFFIISSTFFSKILLSFFNFISYYFLNIFTNVEFTGNSFNVVNLNYIFIIIQACLGIESYLLIILIFLSLPIKLKLSLELILKSVLIFTLFNLFRILIFMLITIKLGVSTFDKFHLFFYQGLNGVILSLIIIYFLKKNSIKNKYPFYSDIKYLIRFINPKIN